jgi:hypothetical protein
MLERDARPAPITLFESAAVPATPVRRGAGSLLSIPVGNIAGDFRAVTLSRGRRQATYELMVANETHAPLATFTYAVTRVRPGDVMTWNAITVPPLSSIAITVEFALPRRGMRQRVIAELHAPDAHLTLEADPPKVHPQGMARRFAIIASGVLLVALSAGAYAAGRPQVVALAAPAEVTAGKPFSVAYALGPVGNAEYTVETPDGIEVGHGVLEEREGAFDVTLPPSQATSGYDLRVTANNRLGDADRVAHIVALAPQAAVVAGNNRAKIYKMSLQQEDVRGGEPIVLDYRASADSGTVKLIDQDGTVRAEALLSHRGNSILIAPYVQTDQDFRVVLEAVRGGTRTESSAPVRIAATQLPSGDFSAPPASAQAPAPETARAVAGTQTGPIAVPGGDFVAGGSIPIAIVHHEKNLHVALVSPLGEEIQGVDVPGDENTVTLPAPLVAASTKYMIVATYARGFEQETVVRPVVIRAR